MDGRWMDEEKIKMDKNYIYTLKTFSHIAIVNMKRKYWKNQ